MPVPATTRGPKQPWTSRPLTPRQSLAVRSLLHAGHSRSHWDLQTLHAQRSCKTAWLPPQRPAQQLLPPASLLCTQRSCTAMAAKQQACLAASGTRGAGCRSPSPLQGRLGQLLLAGSPAHQDLDGSAGLSRDASRLRTGHGRGQPLPALPGSRGWRARRRCPLLLLPVKPEACRGTQAGQRLAMSSMQAVLTAVQ